MIIMISRLEPWAVCVPNPRMARVKMQGHSVEQNSPTAVKAITLVIPPV